MANYAEIHENSAFLFTDFGERKAREWFGDAAIDALPRFVKGKNKGKSKGMIVWRKVVRGGWVKAYGGEGYIENRVNQIISHKLCEMPAYDPYGNSAPYGRLIIDLEEAERLAKWKEQEAIEAAKNAREAMEQADTEAWIDRMLEEREREAT